MPRGGREGERGGKLRKLKSVVKKWQSSLGKCRATVRDDYITREERDYDYEQQQHQQQQLVAVYVGKSRRRYDISSEVAQHPVLQELVERSGDGETVECEVVLFEHLLWMLQNADPQPDSLEDLLDLYA